MNTRTTLILAMLLLVLGAVYVSVVRSRPAPADDADAVVPTAAATRDLLTPPLADVVRVVWKQKAQPEWVFEKERSTAESPGTDVWQVTSPQQFTCVSWEVGKFENRLGRLQYDISYRASDPGAITPEQAGLDPPQAVATLTDADGRSVTVEIGKPASRRETYVRLAGSEEIVVAKADLRELFKDRLLEYRERELWRFEASDVTRVEIVDRTGDEPVDYVFVRSGDSWMIESPVTARATGKVDEMLTAMGRLRALNWVDDDAGRLATYGLDPAALTLRVRVEEIKSTTETASSASEDDDAEAAPPGDDESARPAPEPDAGDSETHVTIYVLHVSNQSPIGDDTKTYLRVEGEEAVATVMKSTTDKFKPAMSEWRQTQITTADVRGAVEIEVHSPQGSSMLVKRDNVWSFEADGGRADDVAVNELLAAIAGLKAAAFVDDVPRGLSPFGLDAPRAEIRLRIPGVEGIERIAVGGYTEPATRHLTYVRRNEAPWVAKVRSADVEKLLRGGLHYRDRTIVGIVPSRFERVALSTENPFVGGRIDIALERRDGRWLIVEPVKAEVREAAVDGLVETLGGLRAVRAVGDESQHSAFGLHAPAVTVTLTYAPTAPSESEPASVETGEAEEGESEMDRASVVLELAEHEGRHFARRHDRAALYEIPADAYGSFLSELRTDRVMEFDEGEVRRFSVRHDDVTHAFVRDDGRWIYEAEPDLPLDSAKVSNLLLQIRDLRTPRYVAHGDVDLASFGLHAPLREASVTLQDGTTRTLQVSGTQAEGFSVRGHYASVVGQPGAFLLTPDTAEKITVSLSDLGAVP